MVQWVALLPQTFMVPRAQVIVFLEFCIISSMSSGFYIFTTVGGF